MVMLEDNPYGSALYFAALNDVDRRVGPDRGLEDRSAGAGSPGGKKIIEIGNAPDVGNGHHGREDSSQFR